MELTTQIDTTENGKESLRFFLSFLMEITGMGAFVYKRNHSDDPNPQGMFGCCDCMKEKRYLVDDNVIGIGGNGQKARRNGIALKLTYIGLGAHKTEVAGLRGPLITFDHFLYWGAKGPLLHDVAPLLAERMYRSTSHFKKKFTKEVWAEIRVLLAMAKNAPPSQFVPELIFPELCTPSRKRVCRSVRL